MRLDALRMESCSIYRDGRKHFCDVCLLVVFCCFLMRLGVVDVESTWERRSAG